MYLLALFSILAVPIAVPIAPGLLDSDSPILSYTGNWITQNEIAYAVGESARSTSTGSVEFDVYTTGFTLFFLYQVGGGDIEVCIESDCVQIETDGAAAAGRAEFTDLDAGFKAVTVSPMTATSILFDGVYVHPDPPALDEQRLTSEPFTVGVEPTEYVGTYILSMTAGEVIVSLLLATLVSLTIVRMVFDLWQRPQS